MVSWRRWGTELDPGGLGGSEAGKQNSGKRTPICKDMGDGLSSFSYLLTAPVCCAQPRETDQLGPCPLDPARLVTRDKIQISLHVM